MNGLPEWTLMVYMVGDKDLSKKIWHNIKQMENVGSTDEVNVVVEIDDADNNKTKRYKVHYKNRKKVDECDETNSGDPITYTNFVSFVKKKFPAKRYALILWGHGTGWEPWKWKSLPRDVGPKNNNSLDNSKRLGTPRYDICSEIRDENISKCCEDGELLDIPHEMAFFNKDENKREKVYEQAFGPDLESKDALETTELGDFLRDAKKILGQNLDLLGFDACLMSNLEVVYQAKDYVNYIVASETDELGEGWPYDAVLRKLIEKPKVKLSEFTTEIVREYVKFYSGGTLVTLSALDLSRINMVKEPLNKLSLAMQACMVEGYLEIDAALNKSISYRFHDGNTLMDIQRFCQELKNITKDSDVREAAEDVCKALVPGLNMFVVSALNNLDKSYCGITIYMVPRGKNISGDYSKLKYAKENKWLRMMEAYHRA